MTSDVSILTAPNYPPEAFREKFGTKCLFVQRVFKYGFIGDDVILNLSVLLEFE